MRKLIKIICIIVFIAGFVGTGLCLFIGFPYPVLSGSCLLFGLFGYLFANQRKEFSRPI